ncbi:MAG: gamma-glutamyltransferase [Anaerolineae bacterium]|nr:gamma-glutamyltransferase [Anaerolineae bacterium]
MAGMVVAPQPLAVEEGVKVLRQGGNAVDAAVACALVQGVVDPHMSSVGGYALATVSLARAPGIEAVRAVDAPALAGSGVTPEMWQDIVIRPNPRGWGYFLQGKVNEMGYQSICTPGIVKGLSWMLQHWGSWSWEQVTEPAARVAEEGFLVDDYLAGQWRTRAAYPEESTLLDYLKSNPEASRIYLREDGSPHEPGDRLRNPDYARTLRGLSEAGPDDFYRGALARRISHDLQDHGSFVSAQDLASYRTIPAEPVIGSYRGYQVATSPAPHGGLTLLAILHILEGYDLSSLGHNSAEYIYLVSKAMKAAFADRNPNLGDPRFADRPFDWMISEDRAQYWRKRIDAGVPIQVSFTPSEPPDTTHVSVVDDQGNCVALTHSLGMSSGVITPGLGFMYNNSMVNFHPLPGHPNSIAPGKARTTGMSPTILYRDGQPVMVLGAPGATRIITSLAQVIVNVLDFGMTLTEAILAPRFDCQGGPIVCQGRIPEYVCAEVRRRHPVERLPRSHGGMGLVHALWRDPRTGEWTGAADAGAGGMALRA